MRSVFAGLGKSSRQNRSKRATQIHQVVSEVLESRTMLDATTMIMDYSRSVGEGGLATVTFLSSVAPNTSITIEYTVTGTASSGEDYEPVSGTVFGTSGPYLGPLMLGVPIYIKRDNLVEGTETLQVTITSVSTGTITSGPFGPSVEIPVSDDPPVVAIVAEDYTGEETVDGMGSNPISFVITRGGGDMTQPIPVSISYSGTATLGSDFTAATTVSVLDRAVVGVSIIDDEIDEGEESIIATLGDGGNTYRKGIPSQATAQAKDNDYTITLSPVSTEQSPTTVHWGAGQPVTRVTLTMTQGTKPVSNVTWSADFSNKVSATSGQFTTDKDGKVWWDLKGVQNTSGSATVTVSAIVQGKTLTATLNLNIEE